MNRKTLLYSGAALVLMGGTAFFLSHTQGRETLAPPGVRTHPLPGSIRLEAELPARVLDYDSEPLEVEKLVLDNLPRDTSFGQRRYTAPDGFSLGVNVVLMGHDRSSIHKPQACLPAQGWQIDDVASTETYVRIKRPFEYDLPVVKLVVHKAVSVAGQEQNFSGLYVYWYVADDAVSASKSNFQFMFMMASKLLRTGVMQRWSYVTCFTPCLPGQEEATFERVKAFIAACAPEFQLYPRAKPLATASVSERLRPDAAGLENQPAGVKVGVARSN